MSSDSILITANLRSSGNVQVFLVLGRIIALPYPVELLDEGSHQVWLLGDEDVLHVALHCCQRPVEGAGDEQPAVHHCKLVMHVHGAHVAPHTDTCGAEGRRVEDNSSVP